MKIKNVLLMVLACALLAGAAQAAAPNLAASADDAAAPLMLAPAASSCAAAGVTLLPAATPAVTLPHCGACSTGGCINARLGTQCGVQGMMILRCTDQGSVCSQDGHPLCACTNGIM